MIAPLLALGLALAAPAASELPRLELSLAGCEREALARSPALKAAESDLASAEADVEAALAGLVPRVTLDGSYQYQTAVPKFSLAPGAPPVQFGDHNAYAFGPAVTYTLWDQGALRRAWRSQKALAASRDAQRELVRRQVLLMTRLDYLQVLLALEQERSLSDSLKLAHAQYDDIDKRFRAGAASRIDWLSAHQQVLDRSRDLRAAQADVASALRTLLALTGGSQDADLSAPLDVSLASAVPRGAATPTALVALDPPESVEGALAAAAAAPLDGAHPQLLVYSEQAAAQREAARSVAAGRWPVVQLSFKSQEQYPETPLLKSVWQNTLALGASVPLFERGRTAERARAQDALAEAADRRRDEARDDLERDWRKARDELAALRDEQELDRSSVAETEEIARLRFASYRAGGSTILDVETADTAAVLARVRAAGTRVQALIRLATLASLSAAKENP